MSYVKFLSAVRGFEDLPGDVLQEVSEHLQEHEFADGEQLLRKGDPGDAMHIIVHGEVQVVSETGNELARIGSSELVGEMALLSGEVRTANVVAAGSVRSLTLERRVLLPLVRKQPALARFLTALVNRRLAAPGGVELIGKYEVQAALGKGATARVFRARHPNLGRIVAIKMLSHALSADPSFTERFLDEARTIAELRHPNIVQIYDAEATLGTYFIVMEMVDGVDADELLRRKGPLSAERVTSILSQLAAALEFAHSHGVVHRDVKPANCMLGKDGSVKLMDFGMAERIERSPGSVRNLVVGGTPRYLAPEVALGKIVDGRADIYSLGVMGFELLTGKAPFASESLRTLLQMHVRMPPPDIEKLRPDLPPGLVAFIKGAMTKRRNERLSNWAEIQRMLNSGEQPSTDPLPAPRREIITLSYPEAAADRIDSALQRMRSEVEDIYGAELSRARVGVDFS